MKNRLLISLVIAASITGAVLVSPRWDTSPAVFYQHEIWPGESVETTGLDEDGVLSTHLPIITLHTNGMEIPGIIRADERKLMCSYSIVWNEDGVNRSDDAPTQTGLLEMSVRGNSSRDYIKKQYALKLVNHEGNPKPESILGMPAETTWVLNGSYIDHSLIRNYMVCNLAGEIMSGYSPRSRLCEVMMTDENGEPFYQGVYTLMEKPKISENRLDLSAYDPNYTETSFLLQMNSKVDNVAITHLQSPIKDYAYNFDLMYPDTEKLTPDSINYIQRSVLSLEKMLNDATLSRDWSKVETNIDVNSFIDYFLLNEFVQNYDAGRRSTYLYRDLGGKFFIGPVWDFDGAFNNYVDLQFPVSELRIKSQFYYYNLFYNPAFCKLCSARYHELRRGPLSEKYLLQYVDKCAAYLGSAAEREMDFWHDGQYELFLEDIQHIKSFIIDRGRWLDENFDTANVTISWKES